MMENPPVLKKPAYLEDQREEINNEPDLCSDAERDSESLHEVPQPQVIESEVVSRSETDGKIKINCRKPSRSSVNKLQEKDCLQAGTHDVRIRY